MKGKHQEKHTTCKSDLRGLSKVPQAMIYWLFFSIIQQWLWNFELLLWFILQNNFMCLLFLYWVFTAARAFSSGVRQGLLSRWGVWASCWLASRAEQGLQAHGLSRGGSGALEQLWPTGLVAVGCGIFPDQGLDLCWQADSLPLRHQGSPDWLLLKITHVCSVFSAPVCLQCLPTACPCERQLAGYKNAPVQSPSQTGRHISVFFKCSGIMNNYLFQRTVIFLNLFPASWVISHLVYVLIWFLLIFFSLNLARILC